MKTKKCVLILFTLFMSFILLLASCNTEVGDESSADTRSPDGVSGTSSAQQSEESFISEVSEDTSSTGEVSLEPIVNEPTEFLTVLDSTLTDRNCFVVVGKCEEGAVITATTHGGQSVTAASDHGFFSARFNKEGEKTRVTIVAEGSITEQYTVDVKPKIPTSDMWDIVGGSGYQFFFGKMMPDFTQSNTLNSSQLSSLTSRIETRLNTLKQHLPNTEIIYMIVPSKASIYPELVPAEYVKGSGKSRLEQVNEALAASGATVIDLLDAFDRHKNDEYKLFWGTDSHWSEYGSFVAYTELYNHISKKFPAAAPRKEIEFDFGGDFYNGGDMVYYMMMDQSVVREFNYLRVPKFTMHSSIASVPRYRAANYLMYSNDVTYEREFNTSRSNLPDIYVMRDSFSTQIYDILAERANNCLYKSMWSYTYNLSEITSFAPDYIIYIVAEWNIDSILQS